MSDEKRYSERELVMAQREAFIRGARYERDNDETTCAATRIPDAANMHFPLPRVSRPRVVRDETGMFQCNWRVVAGALECDTGTGWQRTDRDDSHDTRMFVHAERVRLLADLLAHPTEDVEADDA